MASEKAPPQAELHFEGNSLEVLSRFPDEIKRRLGFSLRQLQIGRLPTSPTRGMTSIGAGVFELKEADERTRVIIMELSGVKTGLLVDSVREVLNLASKDIAPPPASLSTTIDRQYISGIGKVDGDKRMIVLLDVEKILQR